MVIQQFLNNSKPCVNLSLRKSQSVCSSPRTTFERCLNSCIVFATSAHQCPPCYSFPPPAILLSSVPLISAAFLRATLNKLDVPLGSSRKWNSICETTQLDSKIFSSWSPKEPHGETCDFKEVPFSCIFYPYIRSVFREERATNARTGFSHFMWLCIIWLITKLLETCTGYVQYQLQWMLHLPYSGDGVRTENPQQPWIIPSAYSVVLNRLTYLNLFHCLSIDL